MALSKADQDRFADEVYPVTNEAPAEDDKTAAVVGDASAEDSPVRTSRPDVPIAAVMAGGVGEHKPADPDVYAPDGRYIGDVEVADNTAPAKAEKK